jgi:hypothetical protein
MVSSDPYFEMRGTGTGTHGVYLRRDELSVEWYDFGDAVPYESLNYLYFDPSASDALADAIGLAPGGDRELLARAISERFRSYFEVRAFADAHGLAYRQDVDFWP